MKFEEQFPNLYEYDLLDYCETSLALENLKEELQEKFLDKQKVKEAIEKFKLLRDDLDENTFYKFEEELGLEE